MLVVVAAMIAPVSWYACSLRHERRAQHVRGGEARQRARLGPRAPAADGQLELVVDAGERRARLAAAVREDEEDGLGEHELALRQHVGARNVRGQIQRSGAAEHLDAVRRLAHLDPGAGVVGPRIEVDAQPGVAGEGPHDAHDLERHADGEAVGNAGREVDDLPRRAVELESRGDDVRVREVVQVTAHLALAGEDAKGPPLLRVEQAREHRRRVEARETEPLDRRRRRNQREDAAIADDAVIERRRPDRRGGGGQFGLRGGQGGHALGRVYAKACTRRAHPVATSSPEAILRALAAPRASLSCSRSDQF